MPTNDYQPALVKKVLLINGSPKKERSATLHVAQTFLKGLAKDHPLEIETIHVDDLQIHPCLGCLSCWGRTPGECIIKNDDIPSLKQKIEDADIVIESFPLFFFGMPGTMKVMTDRLLSMMSTYRGQKAPENGESFHGIRNPKENQRFVIISSCAYSEADEVYKSLSAQFDCICGKNNYTPIYVPQLKTLIDLNNENKTNRYLSKFEAAGEHFLKQGCLSEEELLLLRKPPFTPSGYKIFLDNFWSQEEENGKKEHHD